MNINLSSVPRFRTGAYGAMVPDDSGEFVKVADLAGAEETHSLQCWPDGRSFTYRGDIHAPTIEVRIDGIWRTATEEEHGQIKINVLASRYADREVFGCDSSLVDDLLRADASGELSGDMRGAFSEESIRNVYADPSSWDADECQTYAQDNGIDLPTTTRHTSCQHCAQDIEGDIFAGDWRDRGNNTRCNDDEHDHEPSESDNENDQDEWLTEAREACQEYAQDNPREPYEWWRVSPWLCAALDSIGEVTIDNGYGHWWGRCATGQGFIMDGVLQRVAAR